MADNTVEIAGADPINYYLRNYPYSDIGDLPILSILLADDLDRMLFKNAAGTISKLLCDASTSSNLADDRVMITSNGGKANVSGITGAELLTLQGIDSNIQDQLDSLDKWTEFSDADFTIYNSADATKVLDFDLSGLTTATTKTLTIPDASGTIALTSDLLWKTDTTTLSPLGAETKTNLVLGGSYNINNLVAAKLIGTGNWFFGDSGHNGTTIVYNLSAGYKALNAIDVAQNNAGLGTLSLYGLINGDYNVGISASSLRSLLNGSNNIGIGSNAGRYHSGFSLATTLESCLYIGSDTKASGEIVTSENVIGGGAIGNGSNTTTIGNSSNTGNYFTGSMFLKEQSTVPTVGLDLGAIYLNNAATPELLFKDYGGTIAHLNALEKVTGGVSYSGGNFGIGTDSPAGKLHVSGTGNVYSKFGSEDATGGVGVTFRPNGVDKYSIGVGAGSSDLSFATGSNVGSAEMTLTSTGNLEVTGNISTAGVLYSTSLATVGGSTYIGSLGAGIHQTLMWGKSESTANGVSIYAQPASGTQTGFSTAGIILNTRVGSGSTPASTGNILAVQNNAVSKFVVSHDGEINFGTTAVPTVYSDTVSATNVPLYIDSTGKIGKSPSIISGTFEATYTGFSSAVTGTIDYIINGNKVELYIRDSIYTTSNATSFTISNMPSALQNVGVETRANCVVNDDSDDCLGMVIVGTTLSMRFYKFTTSKFSSTFTASGNKGLSKQIITYNLYK